MMLRNLPQTLITLITASFLADVLESGIGALSSLRYEIAIIYAERTDKIASASASSALREFCPFALRITMEK